MFLTGPKRLPIDQDQFPATQLFILALVRLSEPIALTSIFPYAWKLVLHYDVGTESDAAFYAGVLIAAFSLTEAMTGVLWGSLSDHIGRKKVLLLGNAGTLLSLLILGLAPNFWVALAGRILGGLLNGNIGVIQTMVGELVTNPKHEPRAFAVMPFVWSVGTILGPSIGGCLADPAKTMPSFFSPSSVFAIFPYLLPNLVCALLVLSSIVAAYFFLFETHPDMQPWSTKEDLENTSAVTPLLPAAGAMANAPADLSTESYGTFDQVQITDNTPAVYRERKPNSRPSSISSASRAKAFSKPVLILIIALGIYTYHSMTFDHLMPIFFQDDKIVSDPSQSSILSQLAGGLGLSMQQVGLIMSFNGLIALFVQAVIFPLMASWFGVWKLYIIVTVGHPLAYFVVPYLVLLPPQWLYTGIYVSLFLRNFFSILAYPLLLIFIKEASPSPSHLGKINGLAASVGGACRTVASPVAGILYGIGSQAQFTALAWWVGALVAILGAAQIPFIPRQKDKTAHVRTAAAWRGEGEGEGNAAVADDDNRKQAHLA